MDLAPRVSCLHEDPCGVVVDGDDGVALVEKAAEIPGFVHGAFGLAALGPSRNHLLG